MEVVLVSGERIEADTVVLAAGAWTPKLARSLGVRLPVQPAKGYSLTLPSSQGSPAPTLPMILAEEKVTLTPLAGHLRFAGTLALAGYDPSVDVRRAEPIRAQVLRYLPHLSPEDVRRTPVWSGFRPASPDGLPLVGRLRTAPGVVVASGHGMMGVTLAPATGRLVADLLTGSPPVVDPVPLDPNRF
jgi:D-amino-acid dehydrogenase